MGFGAIFILLIVLIVLAVLGGGLYMLIMWLRGKQLDPKENKIDNTREDRPRPRHLEVENEQRARFVGRR